MAVALGQRGRLAPILERIAEARGAERFAQRRFQPYLPAKLACIQNGAKWSQYRKGQHLRPLLAALELLECNRKLVLAFMLFPNQNGIRAPHPEIKHDRHSKPWPRSKWPIVLECFDILVC